MWSYHIAAFSYAVVKLLVVTSEMDILVQCKYSCRDGVTVVLQRWIIPCTVFMQVSCRGKVALNRVE